jgi:putative hydrolase of the HAD superfamily
MDAILLDLFGTVVAYGDVVQGTRVAWEGIHTVLQELGSSLAYDAFVPLWEEAFNTPLTPADDCHETVFVGKMARFMRDCGLPSEPDATRRAVDNCLAGWDAFLDLPADVIPTLCALRRDYRLALVSNFDHPPYARELLDRLGLTLCLDAIVISGELRIDKPDPRIVHHALTAVECSAERAVFVGDTLNSDIAGALAAGCLPVLIDRRGRHPDYAGHRIERMGQLPELLARLADEDRP